MVLELGPGQMGEVGERRLAGHSGESGVEGLERRLESREDPKDHGEGQLTGPLAPVLCSEEQARMSAPLLFLGGTFLQLGLLSPMPGAEGLSHATGQ